MAFDVSARTETFEALGEEHWPIADGTEHYAGVDEVEVVWGKRPWLLEVIDLVFDVGGRPAGLDGREVNAVDLEIVSDILEGRS